MILNFHVKDLDKQQIKAEKNNKDNSRHQWNETESRFTTQRIKAKSWDSEISIKFKIHYQELWGQKRGGKYHQYHEEKGEHD